MRGATLWAVAGVAVGCGAEAEPIVSAPAISIHRFAISAATPRCAQWQQKRIYQHGWFFVRIGDAHEAPGLELFYVKGTAEHSAYTATGELLWTWNDPRNHPSAVRVDSNVPLFDLDGDGQLDLVVFRYRGGEDAPRLCRLNAATGDVLAWSPEPVPLSNTRGDTRVSLVPARLGNGRWGLVLHDDYAQVTAFDADLAHRWTRTIPGLGHTTEPIDLDGDGMDELYCGVALLDAGGSVVWQRDDLLQGTGESHPDSNPVVTLDGRFRLFFGPGARMLDSGGRVVWQLEGQELTEVQSIRVLRGPRNNVAALVLTDLPARRSFAWRGMKQRAVDSVSYFLNADLEVIGRVSGCHTPIVGDWTGDGYDEAVLLAPDLRHLLVIGRDAQTIARIAIQERVYVSDVRMAPVLPGSKGDQIILHEWSQDWTEARCVIIANKDAAGRRRPWSQLRSARWTAY